MNVVWHRKGDNPVDTHVLIRRSRKRPEWLEECLSSMEKEPTNILLVDSDSINVGKLRSEAMKLGDAPLLCFVDDDGRVVRGSFQKCIDELKDESLVGVYTDMYEITPEGEVFKSIRKGDWDKGAQLVRPFEVMYLNVFRRSSVTQDILRKLGAWGPLEGAYLLGAITRSGNWKHLPFYGYEKRLTPNDAGFSIIPRLLERYTMEMSEVLLKGRERSGLSTVRSSIKNWSSRDTGCSACNKTRKLIARPFVK